MLVIKLGALGDFVQALGPFAAIRRHHRDAAITLLTTPPFAELAEASGYFDRVWCDRRPRATDPRGWLALRRRLRAGGFGRVYDLQTSRRSSLYYRLFWPGPVPEWSGIASGCSHPHANPERDRMHTVERQAEQLRAAGIAPVPAADLGWVDADGGRFGLAPAFVLLVPGGAPHRPGKRWPAARYGELAGELVRCRLQPVLLGTEGEAEVMEAIRQTCPQAVSLAGRTSLLDLVVLARAAVAAVGNDTGPMHLIAAAGCPSVVLFSGESDPALCGQRGARVTLLRPPELGRLPAAEVLVAVGVLAGSAFPPP